MFKKMMIAIVLLLLPIHAIAESTSLLEPETTPEMMIDSKSGMKYGSAQYTLTEQKNQGPVKKTVSFEGFNKVGENENLALFVDEKSLALKIENKRTGYVWDSGLDETKEYRLNNTWTELAQSAITIDYLDRKGKLKTESILTNDTRPKVKKDGQGFSANINFFQAKISFELKVELTNEGIIVTIPDETIKEGKYTKIVSMKVYPFLGAVNEDEINGYMFIPDGSGALIRYEKSSKKSDSPFIGSIFGSDQGIKRNITRDEEVNPVQQIKIPVFGAVHGVKQNGFISIIEKGQEYGEIVAYPAGVSTDLNWVYSQYNYRYEYYQPTSKSMNGINVYQKDRNSFDIKLHYMLLSDEKADYVGMAKRYQQYLVGQGMLDKKKDNADIRLEFVGGEAKNGLLWDSVISMTKVEEIPGFIGELREKGLEDQFVIYKGWSKGGLTGTLPAKFPLEKKLGSKSDLMDVNKLLNQIDIPIYFHTDYTKAYEGAKGFSGSKDVAKKVSSETISYVDKGLNAFYLSPWMSLEMAKEDVDGYRDHTIKNLALDSTGSIIFSDFSKGNTSTRIETIETYSQVYDLLSKHVGGLAIYEPNSYALQATERYLDIPMYSSNYVFETDTVPFLQIVLKGYIPYYAPFSNFHSDPEDEVLRMIEFGAYPSFLLTSEPSRLLVKTASKDIYTSEYSIWKDDVVKQYKVMKESLDQVKGEEIISRHIPSLGISEVTYTNGVKIIVNYTAKPYSSQGVEVPAKGFAVTNEEGAL